jgi:ABC-type phosphate/phosphonate transport system substrate-binding protein
MKFLVSLPMYNLPEMQGANAAFWSAMRVELTRLGVVAPEGLDFTRKPVPAEIEAGTLFTQVCGWPLQTIYAGQAVILGVPVYRVPHCEGAHHAGVFVVGEGSRYQGLRDLLGCRFVFNSVHSNSGMNLPRRAIAGMADEVMAGGGRFFGSIEETHSQPGNLERVAAGEADATCVDCVTYAFFCRHRPHLAARLRVVATTPSSPAIPFVTSASTGPGTRMALGAALRAVARSPEWAAVRAGLMLQDVLPASVVDYGGQLDYAAEAERLGYPVLQ